MEGKWKREDWRNDDVRKKTWTDVMKSNGSRDGRNDVEGEGARGWDIESE